MWVRVCVCVGGGVVASTPRARGRSAAVPSRGYFILTGRAADKERSDGGCPRLATVGGDDVPTAGEHSSLASASLPDALGHGGLRWGGELTRARQATYIALTPFQRPSGSC